MQILIIEDEVLGQETIVKYLREIDPDISVAGITDSINSSMGWLQNNPSPDPIFMDIELSDGQCFGIFDHAEVKCPVVFTTSYDEYALKAFTVNSIDYLLKPIKKEELKRSLDKFNRLKNSFSKENNYSHIESLIQSLEKNIKTYRDRFLVKQGQRLIFFEIDEIAYFFADNRITYLTIWTNKKYILDYTMEQLEEMLNPKYFFRANRSFIVHIRSIGQVNNYFNGKLKLSLKPLIEAEDIIVSREKAGEFKEWMGK